MKSIGICAGGSTITAVEIIKNGSGIEISKIISLPHEGNPKVVFNEIIDQVGFDQQKKISITGRRFKEFIDLPSIPEPQAIEYALNHISNGNSKYQAVISIGGETFILYTLDQNGRISRVYTGNKCASGTGEFFLQQIRRLDLNIEEASSLSMSETPHHVSGRCSVFCKSDCTHATNIGVPKGQVVAGLSQMMAEKVLELLKNIPKKDILLIGGVTRLKALTEYLKKEVEYLTIPKEAVYFEALGCAIWGMDNAENGQMDKDNLFLSGKSQFDFHLPLKKFENAVTFAENERGFARPGDKCILGLDVGSTTTKAVLLRADDNKIIAGEYLRTNGNPVGASVECYAALKKQLNGTPVEIYGLGATGSGRKIAGLHALTQGTINEIIAHAVAALHFDKEVDTIFEIGGQDAKYTYITNGVASDYAMNEACSAGTGSFLEEAAMESLGVEMEDIAGWAMQGEAPPNFNDQCAAFISSDIKNTHHEGISKENIIGGLVYSICMNYVNRVKGARPVGKKVFMQGGVCYNQAVPIAMAALTGKEIIVPPEPGMMGAFGVALEVKNRIKLGLMEAIDFDLDTLTKRTVTYKDAFVCAGGKEKCDLACSINRIKIENKTYPFGGACNLYYNLRNKIKVDAKKHDLVVKRHEMVYDIYGADSQHLPSDAPKVGLSRSLLMNTFYPIFSHFFVNLGFRPVLSDEISVEGINRCTAAYCYPCEISHGYFYNLLEKDLDYIFLPHIKGVKASKEKEPSKTCPLVQGEVYYLQTTFEKELKDGAELLKMIIDFSGNTSIQEKKFVELAKILGKSKKEAQQAFKDASTVQGIMKKNMLEIGRQALAEIEKDPDQTGIVLFGRPYNAFIPEGNKGIPHKFASRGYTVIPVDFLDLDNIDGKHHMYWSMGQTNLKGARFIKDHPQLFGTFITNFSCGPDSFVIGYFRDILESKPSLTLELDNHTADAGLETRIEAFLDIVQRYRKILDSMNQTSVIKSDFIPSTSELNGGQYLIHTSDGETVDLSDPRVKLVFASMGHFTSEAAAATYASYGVNTVILPEMSEEELKIGRGNTTCKECLPLQLTAGALFKYLNNERKQDEITVYFMPMADGPCRFGQYQDFMKDYVKNHKIRNLTFFSMSSNDGYGGLGSKQTLKLWNSIVISDIFEDIYNSVYALADDRESGLEIVEKAWQIICGQIKKSDSNFGNALEEAVQELDKIKATIPLKDAPQILMVGEIYVRKDGISRRWIPERLADNGIVTHVAPMHEWGYYVDWLLSKDLVGDGQSLKQKMANKIKSHMKRKSEIHLKTIMSKSGWYIKRIIDIDHIINIGERFIDRELAGEAIITVGGPMAEVGVEFCGSIAIGPFGCMPNRLSESILNVTMDREHIRQFRHDKMSDMVTRNNTNLPFLAIESDGNPFPQVIEARLETFIIQAQRLHGNMEQVTNS